MMRESTQMARTLLRQFKADSYVFGVGCYNQLPRVIGSLGRRVAAICVGAGTTWGDTLWEKTEAVLEGGGVRLAGPRIDGAGPNAPREDVRRIAAAIREIEPSTVVAIGGGSGIDAVKAAVALAGLGDRYPDIDAYFGVGRVSSLLAETGRSLPDVVAVQVAASSGAHLTKYSNVTDMVTRQKKLIVDDAIVPTRALFDYSLTTTMSPTFTADGALDGIAHAVEVLYGMHGWDERVATVSATAIEIIVGSVGKACADPQDLDAREKLGLGTDLGGYAIMLGGTNGAHLTSFSLVDILSHGRACALMNPYYTVFFAPAIQPQLRLVGDIFARAGLADTSIVNLAGRDLGIAVAEAMLRLSEKIGFPTTLREVEGFTEDHVRRALEAARDPQLDMKLRNMPVPLSAVTVEDFMGPVLEAAKTGDFSLIRNMP